MTAKHNYYQDFPLTTHTNLYTYLNEYSSIHKVLIEFFKIIPEFNNLFLNDKVFVIRNQFGMINNINEAIVHPGISTNLVISLSNIFGVYITNRLLESIERIGPFTFDPLLLKLLLVIVAFSSGNYRYRDDGDMDHVCDDALSLFSAQNVYVELLWKYILSRSSTALVAMRFFDKLVRFWLHLFDVHLLVDGYINNLPNEIEQMEPLMQSMWPKPNKNVTTLMNEIDYSQ
jgi:hypothetical protein